MTTNILHTQRGAVPPTYTDRQQRIHDFLSRNTIGVLSTVDSEGNPHGVTIYYATSPTFDVAFLTRVGTQKHRDIKHDNRVMLTVFEPATQTTLQVKGHAEEITDHYEINGLAGSILGASLRTGNGNLPITKLHAGPYTGYAIRPTQIRMAVYSRPDASNYENIFDSIESFELEL